MESSRERELGEPLTPEVEGTDAQPRALPRNASSRRGEAEGAHADAGANHDDDDDADDFEEEEVEPSLTVDSLSAVLRPVMITMFLAAVAVANIRNVAQDAALASGLNVYLVYGSSSGGGSGGGGSGAGGGGGGGGGGSSGSSGSSTGTLFGEAAINALVIVSVICAATFVLVACYYFRCLKLMLAYLMFASVNLLGYSGGFLAVAFVERFRVLVDWATLVFVMWNFAIVGVVAVFFQKGVPRQLTQWYLIAVSVIMAWLLTKLPEWTNWALLVALALYDLCAVLTPCGPLKALVNLAQERRDPIPGLLYEADVGGGGGGGGSGGGGGGGPPGGKPQAEVIKRPLACSLEDLFSGATKKVKVTRQRLGADGKSARAEEKILEIPIRPGWKKGTTVTFPAEGDELPGVAPADIAFVVAEKEHARFTREGDDLIHVVRLSLADALCGSTLHLETLDGRMLSIAVPEVVSPGYTKRVPGEGMPLSKEPGKRGSLVLRFNIVFPRDVPDSRKLQLRTLLS